MIYTHLLSFSENEQFCVYPSNLCLDLLKYQKLDLDNIDNKFPVFFSFLKNTF